MTPLSLFIPAHDIEIMGEPRTIPIAIPIPGRRGKGGRQLYRGAMLKPDHFDVNHKDDDQARWARANVWARRITETIRQHIKGEPLDLFFRVDLEWVFPRHDNHYGTGKNADKLRADAPYFHGARPDIDNLNKLFLDTCTRAGLWVDDSRVCDGRIIKRYQRTRAEPTGVRLRISEAIAGASITDDPLVSKIPGLFQEEGTAV